MSTQNNAGTQTPETDALRKRIPLVALRAHECLDFAERLETERNELRQQLADATKKQPINTHVRLFDLVRYMRSELHEENLITDEEYAWLAAESPMATSPKGGSPSPRRLEDYDEVKAQLAAATQEAEQAKRELKEAEWLMTKVNQPAWDELKAEITKTYATLKEIQNAKERTEADLRAQLTEAQSQLKDREVMIAKLVQSRARVEDQLSLAQAREKKLVAALEYYAGAPWASVGGVQWYNHNFAKVATAALANATPSGAEPTQAPQ